MGRDKALLELAGETLIERAVKKLRRVCAEVYVLSGELEPAKFVRLIPDIHLVGDVHPGCGPVGGMEAALVHSAFDWNLFLPVDMPFLPTGWIAQWVGDCLVGVGSDARIHMVTVDGRLQPGFCLLHREVLPFLTAAIELGDFKLMTVLQAAGRALAGERGLAARDAQDGQRRWFSNLNTPEDFADAEIHAKEVGEGWKEAEIGP